MRTETDAPWVQIAEIPFMATRCSFPYLRDLADMLTQPEGLIARIAMKMALEITAELRRAGVADLHRDG